MSNAESQYLALYEANLIPLRVCLAGFTWGLHDYFVTIEDEIHHIWPQKSSIAKSMFLWIRYYTLALLLFDVVQIHVFTLPGVTSDNVCVAMDSIIRVVSAISLWSVEIVMQLRVYALYNCSKRVAILNCILFLGSIAGFMFILVHNAQRRRAVIADAIALPLPGCPSIHTGIEWAQWVPATIYEGILFGYALYKTIQTNAAELRRGGRISLRSLLLRDNLFYFFAVACILVFNNLMVVGVTHIPWFSYGPFHAAVGILTTRMMLNVHKAANKTAFMSRFEGEVPGTRTNPPFPKSGTSGTSWNVAQNSLLTSSA
ncbi:hypothetical protein J3R30DRAFT_165340 [Lentinula aciculospora]|uniref:DUF6533 domain-containing protein n=1 Tax=Lentinula aciculospora TaxID=153920 RepID=A0A9W9DZ12_9AGAR|nr:hypothetical protein J3R30DRAFT_165340 [Lentinula aciculospora]